MSTWKNYNPIINAIADEQGIEVGSKEWVLGGIEPSSGTTGAAPSYGFRHDHKLDAYGPDYVNWVIANYAHRRAYYGDAPIRMSGYNDGGRPKGWTPEDSKDLPKGQVGYLTSNGVVDVSGPDILHFQLGPLFAVYDTGDQYTVKAQGKDQSASFVSGILIRMLMSSMAGQIRSNTKFLWGDRGAARIIDTFTQAIMRSLVEPEDIKTFLTWLDGVAIPFYSTAPGLSLNNKPKLIDDLPNFQIYNGLYWLLPAFYDFYNHPVISTQKNDIVIRMSQWIEDIVKTQTDGLKTGQLTLPDGIIETPDNKPVPSLYGIIKPENLHSDTNWSLWAFRACCIAGKVLNSQFLLDEKNVLIYKIKPKISVNDKAWLVDENRNYV